MRKRLAVAAFVLLLLPSCRRYLDVKPQGMVLPSTDEEFAAIIHDHLRDIEGGGDELLIGNMKSIADREGCADDLDANISAGSNLVSYAGEIINQRQREYRDYWEIVRDCHIVTENLEGRESETARHTLSAAYAMKALCYYRLIRDFCPPWEAGAADGQIGLPIVERLDITARPGRSSLLETAEYARSLFDKSLALQPEDPLYLFTEYVVKGFKARLLFWMEDWEGCFALCEDILQHCGRRLASRETYQKVLDSDQAEGEVLLKSHIDNSSELDWYFSFIRGYIDSRPAGKGLIRLYGDAPEKDVRWKVSFDARRKNAKKPEQRLRLSEILLMAAECACHRGEAGMALDLINTLRENRIQDAVPYTEATLPPVRPDNRIVEDACGKPLTPLLQLILDERRKELYLEGDRWFELKRNGRPEWWVISGGLKYTTRKYLYTAPIYKGDVNPEAGTEQNPGYVY